MKRPKSSLQPIQEKGANYENPGDYFELYNTVGNYFSIVARHGSSLAGRSTGDLIVSELCGIDKIDPYLNKIGWLYLEDTIIPEEDWVNSILPSCLIKEHR